MKIRKNLEHKRENIGDEWVKIILSDDSRIYSKGDKESQSLHIVEYRKFIRNGFYYYGFSGREFLTTIHKISDSWVLMGTDKEIIWFNRKGHSRDPPIDVFEDMHDEYNSEYGDKDIFTLSEVSPRLDADYEFHEFGDISVDFSNLGSPGSNPFNKKEEEEEEEEISSFPTTKGVNNGLSILKFHREDIESRKWHHFPNVEEYFVIGESIFLIIKEKVK